MGRKRANFHFWLIFLLILFFVILFFYNREQALFQPVETRRIFVTGTVFNGDLGGLAGADQKCQDIANIAALGGTWKAWLGDSTTRVEDRLIHFSGQYVQTGDGAIVAEGWDDLFSGNFLSPVIYDERGNNMGSVRVWTGNSEFSCNNWNSQLYRDRGQIGISDSVNSYWKSISADACTMARHLYCVEESSDGGTVDDTIYLAFRVNSQEEFDLLMSKLGNEGIYDGKVRLALSIHMNPLGNKHTENVYPFRIDPQQVTDTLNGYASYNLPLAIGIFAGKFFQSDAVTYLEQNNANLMWDNYGRPILLDRIGGTYFSLAHPPLGFENEFLTIYERNVLDASQVAAQWIQNAPVEVVSVSFAGETKYPPAKEEQQGPDEKLWADYNPVVIELFREYLEVKYEEDFFLFMELNNIPLDTFNDFSEVDPPRGQDRGSWDVLNDPNNPYFMEWHAFRLEFIKNHIRECVNWGRESGITETDVLKIYSHQAIWDTESPESYYWRGAPIETLQLEGINPAVSMYGDKTADSAFIQKVGEIGIQYPGRWSTLQYNPDGPCDENGICDPNGYSVEEYYNRLKLLEQNGIRVIAVEGELSEDGEGTGHFVRENFYLAAKQFLAE